MRGWFNATSVGSASCWDLDFSPPCPGVGGGVGESRAWPVTSRAPGEEGAAVDLCQGSRAQSRGLPRCPTARAHLDDLQHLHARDLAVAVQVVHVEGPVQLLLEAAPGRDGQGADELSEVDGAVPILVEGAEGVLGELGGVPVREELQSGTDTVRGPQGENQPI